MDSTACRVLSFEDWTFSLFLSFHFHWLQEVFVLPYAPRPDFVKIVISAFLRERHMLTCDLYSMSNPEENLQNVDRSSQDKMLPHLGMANLLQRLTGTSSKARQSRSFFFEFHSFMSIILYTVPFLWRTSMPFASFHLRILKDCDLSLTSSVQFAG